MRQTSDPRFIGPFGRLSPLVVRGYDIRAEAVERGKGTSIAGAHRYLPGPRGAGRGCELQATGVRHSGRGVVGLLAESLVEGTVDAVVPIRNENDARPGCHSTTNC